jgi:poly-beta-1,6-N-acetyl-D-glucosamine synthase
MPWLDAFRPHKIRTVAVERNCTWGSGAKTVFQRIHNDLLCLVKIIRRNFLPMRTHYILLTAAKNEAEYIGATIQSVLRQTIRPCAWFIVDDGSTDRTAEVIQEFAAEHSFIHLHSAGAGEGRNFGSQYKAIQAAYSMAKEIDFDFVGVQDADIEVERSDYYETVLNAFHVNPQLGITGGYIYERVDGEWKCRTCNAVDSVAGGVQMFRRECFEQIGGYKPLTLGGSDWLAQIEARKSGWEAIALPELHALHYRPTSSAGGRFRGLFKLGLLDASFGSHPVFESFKCGRRVMEKPLLGSLIRFSGYLWWNLSGREPLISRDAVEALQKGQWNKIKATITRQEQDCAGR